MPAIRLARSAVAAAVVSALLAAVASAGQSSSQPRLSASPSRVASRGRVVVRGAGWSEAHECEKSVHLLAFIVGLSPYPAVTVGTGRLSGGRFTIDWRAPATKERWHWTIRGAQKCGTTTAAAYTKLTIG